MKVKPVKSFNMALSPPPDKSITIRALIMGMLSDGITEIVNPLISGDTLSAMRAITALGASIDKKGCDLIVKGGKINSALIDAGNSATTLRLTAGAICGRDCLVTLSGDESLRRRDMSKLIDVLGDMGAGIESKNGYAPIRITGKELHGIDFQPAVPSAQLKGAVLLAGLNAEGTTRVRETIRTRTHTEDMLPLFGADMTVENGAICVRKSKLSGARIDVPGDMSSAAYPVALALMRGFCYIKNVGLKRREFLDFLIASGADIKIDDKGDRADVIVRKSQIKPFEIGGAMSAALIDELPLLAVLACFTGSRCVVKDAAQLRNKECDRIRAVVLGLRAMGVEIEERADGFAVEGRGIKGGSVKAMGDHRIAMAMAVAAALSEKGGTVDDGKCVEISYPGFWELLQ